MTEREPPEPVGLRWTEFTACLSPTEHRRLVLALGAGLREARKAAEAAYDDGLLQEVVVSLDLAIEWLTQARRRIGDGTDAGHDAP